jgi:CRISPR-associated helicase Cas3/CRISPR-associated endonuclease Cas3-HD
MSYYAHSANSQGQAHPLQRHLDAVGRIAGKTAGSARWSDEAALAGRLHDLGKFGDLFQARLRGDESGLDHWSAGAVVAATDPSIAALAAALAIEGHHIGLQAANSTAVRRRLTPANLVAHHPLRLRLTDTDTDFSRLRQRAEDTGISFSLPAGRVLDRPDAARHAIATMLDVRLLFSCLVDADFLDTEAHFEADQHGKRYRDPGPLLASANALAALDRHMTQAVRGSSRAEAEVAGVRESLWKDALRAAELEPGLFTLTAPTGSGKTLAMLKFALEHAQRHGLRRIVLAVPFLSIIEQTARVYGTVFDGFAENYLLEHHSLAGLGPETAHTDSEADKSNPHERQRRLLAQNWDAPIVLTTNVQLLESLFSNRPAACRKLHRLMESVILFDEAQSLPRHLATPTLAALSHLSKEYRSSVVFATATQPAFDTLHDAVRKLAVSGWSPREIAADNARMFKALRRFEVNWPQADERKRFADLAQELSADDTPQVLCVVNLKKHAQALMDVLQTRLDRGALFHLSTNLCAAHRREVLDQVRSRLADDAPCRLISTQCIEAGVDLDFPVVYRALGPLEAIAQAAGRCNREGRLRASATGRVVVFDPADDEADNDANPPPSRERWRGRYPNFSYWQATELTRTMLRQYGSLDLNDPNVFRDYYRRLFDLAQPESQSPELARAIDEMDFPEIAHLYRLIDQDTIQIVVPWSQRLGDYARLRDEALQGIDRHWMTRAQSLAVSIYRPKADHPARAWLLPVHFRRGGDSDEWFVLDDPNMNNPQRRLYDDTLGLRLPDAQRILIA